eukprot:11205086-Lingulodinium_polyedra.AAC.1
MAKPTTIGAGDLNDGGRARPPTAPGPETYAFPFALAALREPPGGPTPLARELAGKLAPLARRCRYCA